jgi:cytoskeletal protein CcmA (bactofilin family)
MESLDTASAPGKDQMSVIGAGIKIIGNIEPTDATVDLHIEGEIVGDVRCSTLILGEASSIKGGIKAERVRVSGIIEGAIDTHDLAIEATARVAGEISYARLRVASGARLAGTLTQKAVEDHVVENARLKLVETPPPAPPVQTERIVFE